MKMSKGRKYLVSMMSLAVSVGTLGCGAPQDEPVGISTFSLTRPDVTWRAWQWVDAAMPYCQARKDEYDTTCKKYCRRSGKADNSQWNSYRSDCSGLVAWAFGLPTWHNTSTLKDYNITQKVGYWDMQRGDALITDGHAMIFVEWVNSANGQARVIQEKSCGQVATDSSITFTKLSNGSMQWSGDNNRIYWPYKLKTIQ